MRALMQRVRSLVISAPRLPPEVWCAPLGPSSLAARLGTKNSQIQRLDPEKSPENHRRAIHSDAVGPTKRIPSANYSLSIPVQENALRVMCLPRGTPGSAPGQPELLQRRPALCETLTGRRRRSPAAAALQHPLREILDCYTQAVLY